MARTVRAFRGILRGNLKVGKRVGNSLLAWHNKHDAALPEGQKLLDTADVTEVTNFIDLMSIKLAQTKSI